MRKIEVILPDLYPKQKAAIFDKARYSVIEASTKAGKTLGCLIWLFQRSLRYGGPGRNFWWVAPVSGQANIAFKRARRGIRMSPAPAINLTDKTIELANGSTIWFKSGDKPDSLYGEDVHAAVIDEASRCKDEAWHAVRSTLSATNGPVRIIGNVKGRRNWAWQLGRKALAGAPDMAYHKLTALDAVEGGVLKAKEVEDARSMLPDHIFRELFMAEPSDDGGNPFGQMSIERCVCAMSEEPPVVWGWDLAKSQDWTVGIGLDIHGKVCRFVRFQKPWQETLSAIVFNTGRTPAVIDSTGVGDPIVEALQRSGKTWFESFKFTSQSKQQIMEGLAVGIQQGAVGYPNGQIKSELQAFEYEYKRTGVKYSAPEGVPDDCVCSLAMAWSRHGHAKASASIQVGIKVPSL